jgi:protein O-GlcNAc transferase
MGLLARLLNRKSTLESGLSASPAQQRPATNPSSENDQSDSVAALTTLANRHFQAGELDSAREVYKRVLELDPANARTYYMLSGLAVQDGDIASAVGLAQRAIAHQPTVAEFHFSLAGVYVSAGRIAEAVGSYQEASRLKPDSLHYRQAAAGALVAAGRLDEGIEAYRAIALASGSDGQAYFDLGKALQVRGDDKEAEGILAQAVKLSPDLADIHLHLALARKEQDRPVEAETPARQAVALAPDLYQGWLVLGSILADQGRHAEAVEYFEKVLAISPDDEQAWSAILFSMNYSERFSASAIFAQHVRYGELFPPAPAMPIEATRSVPARRLRVGYLSPDFRNHPVAYFMSPILSRHDRSAFEVFCYATHKSQDDTTLRLKRDVEHWRQLGDIPDDDLERILRTDQLDILVELAGHSARQRLAVLARRVAPVQVTYLGYPNTTGVAAIDYRITDACADPPGESDKLHVEKLVRLPEAFLCYAPPTASPPVGTGPVHRNGYITFASFNKFAKISPLTVKLWSRVLAAVPNSKLLVKSRGLQDPGLHQPFVQGFAQQGIGADRIALMQPAPDTQEHLQTYGQVDIALDTFPYHGTTTTMEALWMGVPVITLEGDRHASRVGTSILSTLGLPDLVAHSEDEYVEIATRLAANVQALDALRQSLRLRLSESPLTDGARFTAHLEQAYLQMWQETLTRSGQGAPALAANG